jgi:hypothetical protein
MSELNIKRFLTQWCIGYNDDYSESYISGNAKLADGSYRVVYCTVRRSRDGFSYEYPWTTSKPLVTHPNPKSPP